ncbi:hypothetical protein Tco_1227171 [Tanacetum coccineum]
MRADELYKFLDGTLKKGAFGVAATTEGVCLVCLRNKGAPGLAVVFHHSGESRKGRGCVRLSKLPGWVGLVGFSTARGVLGFGSATMRGNFLLDDYLGSKVGDVFQKELQKHTAYLIHKYSIQPAPEFTKIQTPTANLEKPLEKSPSKILKIKREQAEKQKMWTYTIKSTD